MESSTQPPENQADIPQNGVSQNGTSQQDAQQNSDSPKLKWEPLNSTDRRVIGVLVEKAKTTPDAYPLTLNALCNGCNQKSNRSPFMQLEPAAVEESLERLRQRGAVLAVQGGGRVDKYRHNMYEWLGVSKQEIAVMAELLLRGAQTQGELRARAARMEAIAGLAELQPIVQALKERGLVVPLTPEGRGHILTHNLYKPQEMEKLLGKYSSGAPVASVPASTPPGGCPSNPPASGTPTFSQTTPSTSAMPPAAVADKVVDSLQSENNDLRMRVTDLNAQVAELTERVEQTERSLRELSDSLGG